MAGAFLTPDDLAGRYPEIAATVASNRAFVQTWLDSAAIRTPIAIWCDRTQEGHGALAMHLIAITPYGRDARLVNENGESTYGTHRARLERELGPAVAPRVT